MNEKISIIIPTTGIDYENLLFPCLDSIVSHTSEEILTKNINVIVVYNPFESTGDKFDRIMLDKLLNLGDNFHIIKIDKACGFASAVNYGIMFDKQNNFNTTHFVLLNDDAKFISINPRQPLDLWLKYLLEPFRANEKCGLTGPILGYSNWVKKNFLIFFCVMIKKQVFDDVGLLDTSFNPGGGEDTAFCLEAEKYGWECIQVPFRENTKYKDNYVVGGFPIYHKGEQTVFTLPDWEDIFLRNSLMLKEKYDPDLGNNYERAVIGLNDHVPLREHSRYSWAMEKIDKGSMIIEIGCSSGYGWKYFEKIPDITYIGFDKDQRIIDFAKEQFGEDDRRIFRKLDVENCDCLEDIILEAKKVCPIAIVAFEVLEHMENGKELAQKFIDLADQVLITVPYNESKGLWGPHHKLHNLTEADFPRFKHSFLAGDGKIHPKFTGDIYGLLLGEYRKERKQMVASSPNENHVLCFIPTANRYSTTLPLTLASVINQTRKPDRVVIYDDGDHFDLRTIPIFGYLFKTMDELGISWEVVFGSREGQHKGHELSQKMAKSLVWRIDDDEVAEPKVLQILLREMRSNSVSAVGGLVLTPPVPKDIPSNLEGLISNIYYPNLQWFRLKKKCFVEHLHSTFLYKAGIASYSDKLSPASHREETMFTYELVKKTGRKVLIVPEAVTWHYRNSVGGIRQHTNKDFWDSDERVFMDFLAKWKVTLADKPFIICLDVGLGDTIVFSKLVPLLLDKHERLEISAACPEPLLMLNDDRIKIISIQDAVNSGVNPKEENVYAWMAKRNWSGDLYSAFKEMYLG